MALLFNKIKSRFEPGHMPGNKSIDFPFIFSYQQACKLKIIQSKNCSFYPFFLNFSIRKDSVSAGLEGFNYRYHFNNKESDNEVIGEGNQVDYGFRVYDPRLGRFLSVDPITKDYPELTPYQFASNRPIDGVDIDGLEWKTQHSWTDVIEDENHIKLLGDRYVKGMTYVDAWRILGPEFTKELNGKVYECADVSIYALVKFAFTFKLSIHFEDYKAKNAKTKEPDPTFDNDNYGYVDYEGTQHTFKEGDWESLAKAIYSNYGAADLLNNKKLTININFNDLKPGDMVGYKATKDNPYYHNSTVYKVYYADKPGGIFQGDWHWGNDYAESYTTYNGSTGTPVKLKLKNIEEVKNNEKSKDGRPTQALRWNFKQLDK